MNRSPSIVPYVEAGPEGGRPVVLIHAFPLSHAMWAPQIARLSAEHRVIAYDVRGLGQSEVGDGHYTMEFFVDDLIALMDHLKIRETAVCGLSLGGYVALRAVERHPERFRALVLCDTRSEADTNEGKRKRSASLKLLKEKGLGAFCEEMVKSLLAPETLQNRPEVVQKVKEMILANSPLGVAGNLLALASRTDTTESLPKIKIPTLVLVGEKDAITPPSAALSLIEKIPNARLYVIPGAGHLSNLENPEEFNRRLLESGIL